MKKLNIVIVSSGLAPEYGGAAVSEGSLCGTLAKNCTLSVLCRRGHVNASFAKRFGIPSVIRYEPKEVFQAWTKKCQWLEEVIRKADVLHINGHWKWENYFFARLCKRYNVPYVLHPRGMLLVGHRKVLLKRIFNLVIGKFIVRHAHKIIALSHFEQKQFAPYKTNQERVEVIPNGIPVIGAGGNKSTYYSMARNGYFLYFGRLESRKNLLFLLEAFARYMKCSGKKDLLFLGPVERGYDKAIRQKVASLGLTNRVKILAPVYGDKKWEVIRGATAVVYPAIEEPFGRVPFEAVAAGVPPIVPDASGSSEYLEKFLPNCIYKHQNVESLMNTFFGIEKKADETGGLKRAKAWIKKDLDWDRISQRVLRLYEEALPARS